MKDRVKQVQDHYKLSQKQFAAELGVAEATISSVYRGRTAPTNNLIQAVHNAYPAVNINWLMFGEGEMLLPLTPETAVKGDLDLMMDGSEGYAQLELATDNPQNDLFGQNVGFSSAERPPFSGGFAAQNSPQNASKTGQFSGLPTELQLAEALSLLKKTNEVDKVERRIKEIRVFFDDGTFETFAPSNK